MLFINQPAKRALAVVLCSVLVVCALSALAVPARGASIVPSWAEGDALPSPTNDATVVQDSDSSVVIAGGLSGSSPSYTVLSTVWRYNLTTGAARSLAPMPEPLFGAAGAADDQGKVYVMGGRVATLGLSSAMYIYDPATDSWSDGTDIPTAVWEAKAARLGGTIYVFGGQIPGAASKLVQKYDIETNAWSAGPDMTVARYGGALAVDSVEEQIYYIGGSAGVGDPSTSTVLRYSVNGVYWGAMDDAPFSMVAGCAVTGPDGLIYVFGGGDDPILPRTPYQTSWCFNPEEDTWTAGPELLKAVMYAGAGRNDTSVFVIGGCDGNTGTTGVQSMKVFDYHIRVSNVHPGPGQEVTLYFDIDSAFGSVDRAYFIPVLETPDGYSATLTMYVQGYSMAIDTDRFFVTMYMPEDLTLGVYNVTFYISGISIGGNEVLLEVDPIPLEVTSTTTVRDQVSDLQGSVDGKADSALTYLAVALSVVAVVMLAMMMVRRRQ